MTTLPIDRPLAGHAMAATPRLRAPWHWTLVGGVVGLALTLLLYAPARWMAWAVEHASDGRLRLEAPQGTVWSGSAQPVLTGGDGSHDAAAWPSRIVWRLRPAIAEVTQDAGRPTLAPAFDLALSADCCTRAPLAITASWTPGSTHVALADGPVSHWPASLLTGLGTPWNTLAPEGQLELRTQGLRLQWVQQRLRVSGRAELTVRDAATRLTPLRPVGSYRLTMDGGALPDLRLETLQGGLQLSGSGQWVGERLRFTGEALAQPGTEAALDNVLNIIGRRAGTRALISLG